jgi:hypothetical protein
MARPLNEPSVSSRIKRFYYYQWSGGTPWDSGLVNYQNHKRRAIYYQYRRRIRGG